MIQRMAQLVRHVSSVPNANVALWRSVLQKSLDANNSEGDPTWKYMTLATKDASNHPRCRTIVFRGFGDFEGDGDCIMFVTDARSAKVDDIKYDPRVELCWYLAKTCSSHCF